MSNNVMFAFTCIFFRYMLYLNGMLRLKEIRKQNKLKTTDVAKALGVSQSTLSSWERGRISPSINMILKMTELYKVSTDYLLGKDFQPSVTPVEEIPLGMLPALHEKPVWLCDRGWALVDAMSSSVILTTGERIAFSEITKAVMKPEYYSVGDAPRSVPIPASDLSKYECVWVEPISYDFELRQMLRGRYKIINGIAENDYGQKFSIGTYGASWLAFEIK